MNEYLKKFREQHPSYNDMTDADLVKALHTKYYADMPLEDFAKRIGYAEQPQGMFGGGEFNGAGSEREWGPHEEGRLAGKESGALSAAAEGTGSGMFGVGTVTGAVDEFMRSRAEGKPRSWNESLEFARGQREGASEEHPYAYGAGAALGLYTSGKGITSALSKAPAVVKSVFALQKGQTLKNIARLGGSGAAASAATAGMQEGVDEVPQAAVAGGVLGLAVPAVARGTLAAGRVVMARIKPDNAAIRALAKRFKESAPAITKIYNDFVDRTGRNPGLAEIVSEVEAGRVGQIGAQFSSAGNVFRAAEEAAADARPEELRKVVARGGIATTVPEQTAALAPIAEETRRVVDYQRGVSGKARVNSTAQAQEARRDKAMDTVMGRIGGHYVHATEAIKDVLEHPDVQGVLPPILRRRINNAIANGMDFGSIDIPLHLWEKMRYEMSKRAGAPGASQFYSEYRDRIRDYVSGRIPEYGKALLEYGRRTVGADATAAAESAVKGSAREFADMLRIAGDKTHGTTARATTRVGVRNWLSNQLSGTAQQAERTMARLARDGRLRANLRATLSDDEAAALETLGNKYGVRLNVIEGVKTGNKILKGDAEHFADAVKQAYRQPGAATGVEAGARSTLISKAGESPAAATGTALALAKNPGLQDRIAVALGVPEARRLQRASSLVTQAARNLRAATPSTSQAQQEAAEQAQKVYNAITGAVALTGTASGALKAHLAQRIASRVNLGSKAAARLAEYATDPDKAHIAIKMMHEAGVSAEELLKWYHAAAIAAGTVGGAISAEQ